MPEHKKDFLQLLRDGTPSERTDAVGVATKRLLNMTFNGVLNDANGVYIIFLTLRVTPPAHPTPGARTKNADDRQLFSSPFSSYSTALSSFSSPPPPSPSPPFPPPSSPPPLPPPPSLPFLLLFLFSRFFLLPCGFLEVYWNVLADSWALRAGGRRSARSRAGQEESPRRLLKPSWRTSITERGA
eukprot:8409382-Pyramimonas_sp.AAC.2